jgi:hypothetical protein
MIQKGLWVSFILFILLAAFAQTQAMRPPMREGIIYPGEGVNDIRIGKDLPKGIACGKTNEVLLECDGDRKRVKAVTVWSPFFYVIGSRLRVGSNINDLFRFYGEGEVKVDVDKRNPDKIVIVYPSQGIDFEISKSEKKITGIKVYQPILPKFLK